MPPKQVCKYYQQGNCRYGNSCKFLHSEPVNAGLKAFQERNPADVAKIIQADLKELKDFQIRPALTTYGVNEYTANSLIEGRDMSFEELRLKYMEAAATNTLDAYNKDLELRQKDMEYCINEIKSKDSLAARYQQVGMTRKDQLKPFIPKTLEQSMNDLRNNHSGFGASSGFGSANSNSGFGSTNSNSGFGSSGFGSSGFGNSGAFGSQTTSPFGQQNTQSSAFGNQNSVGAFGNQSTGGAFGNQSTGGAFGNQSTGGAFGSQKTGGAFGNQNTGSAFGSQNTGGVFGNQNSKSAFGSSSNGTSGGAFGSSGFGSSGFGSTTSNNASGSAFGTSGFSNNTSGNPSGFGGAFGSQNTKGAFGSQITSTDTKPFGSSSAGENKSAQQSTQQGTGFGSSGFGQSGFGQSGFGQSGFGQSGFGQSGFGQSGFGQSGFGQSGFGQSGFGKPAFGSSSGQSAFGSANQSTTTSGFGQSGFGTSAENKPSPFGQATESKGSPFGQRSETKASPFGQTTETKASSFGQSAPSTASSFGQFGQAKASTASTSSSSTFGQSALGNTTSEQTTSSPFGQSSSKPVQTSTQNPFAATKQPGSTSSSNPSSQSTQAGLGAFGGFSSTSASEDISSPFKRDSQTPEALASSSNKASDLVPPAFHDPMFELGVIPECPPPKSVYIKQLFTEFKSKYIQMTVCPKCGKLADKYIEFDYVILFLDVLLLKPQAYRHLAFNVVEESLFFITDDIPFFERYKKLLRYATLTILFEVYLNWAYEERNDIHSVIVAQILQKPIPLQYMFFIFQQLAERIVLCVLIDKLLRTFAGWGRNPNRNLPEKFHRGYFVSVLLSTVFMSLSIKCIPIIMLIWPYDNPQVASVVVDILGLANTIEALRLIVGSSYISISTIVIVATASF
ncbi:hypothetical protein RJF_4498 [Candidozyma auris]